MSSSSGCCLVILLLCLALQSCSGLRLHGTSDKRMNHPISVQIKDEEVGLHNKLLGAKSHPGERNRQGMRIAGEGKLRKEKMGLPASRGGVRKNEAVVSVSWQVPHKNVVVWKQQPGFEMDDYSWPKTHPPSNN